MCGDDEKLALHEIDGDDGIARAESCENCNSYLKIIYQGKNAHIDPVADDLASIALDMLVDEAGFERAGPNLLLIGAGSE
jgi:FdhE protein